MSEELLKNPEEYRRGFDDGVEYCNKLHKDSIGAIIAFINTCNESIKELEKSKIDCVRRQDYSSAAIYRDKIDAIQKSMEVEKIISKIQKVDL